MSVVLCGGAVRAERRTRDCPICGIKDSELVTTVLSSAYWDPITTCTNCGDCWSGGELGMRPFRRGWRQKAIAWAVASWEAGCACPVRYDDEFYLIPCEHQAVQ